MTFGSCRRVAWLKDQVNVNIFDVTVWKKTISRHILPTISRSESNQTMRLSQLIECDITNIFLEKSNAKGGWRNYYKTFFWKIKIENIPRSSLKSYTICFNSIPSWVLLKYTETKGADYLFLPQIKPFRKTKRGLWLIFLTHFLHDFWIKIFLLAYLNNWPNFTVWLPLLR